MATMVSRLLEVADLLLRAGAHSSAFRRRAVSTAYYAVFHSLAKHCADDLLQPIDRTSDEYSRVYRALEHGALRSAFSRDSPLKKRKNLRDIGDLVIRLQSERHRADYLPPITNVFSLSQAQKPVDEARDIITDIESLSEQDRCVLATHLLFKNRQPQ
jgi:uncharacterized protein (UPF0332 family)